MIGFSVQNNDPYSSRYLEHGVIIAAHSISVGYIDGSTCDKLASWTVCYDDGAEINELEMYLVTNYYDGDSLSNWADIRHIWRPKCF